MDARAIMTEVGQLLLVIPDLKVFDYETPVVTAAETAIVGYPEQIDYNQHYGPDGFRFDLPLVVVIPNPTAKGTTDKLLKYTNTSGEFSVKYVLENPGVGYSNFDVLTVKEVTFDEVTINNVQYSGALFTLDIAGGGE